jgi:hypothetical protein
MARQKNETQTRQLFKAVFDSPEGREVLSHLRALCFMDTHCFVAGDPHMTSFNEGKRATCAYILSLLREQPKAQEVAIDDD